MKEKEVNLDMACKVWWAQAWRTLPIALLLGVFASILFQAITASLGVDKKVMWIMNVGLGVVVALICHIWILKRCFTDGFGKYRLALMEKEDA